MKENTMYIHPEVDKDLVEALQSYARAERITFPEAIDRAFREFLKGKTVADPFMDGEFIPTAEVMEIIGCSKQTIYNLMRKGVLQGIRSGKNLYFNKELVLAYKDAHITTRGHGYGDRETE